MVVRGNAIVLGLLTVVLFSAVAMSPAVAQAQSAIATDECPDGEQIDRYTRLCNAQLDSGDAVLTFQSETDQTITLTDAGAFSSTGEVATRSVGLSPGSTTIRFSITKTDTGKAGVGIETPLETYSRILKEDRHLIGGPWTVNDARIAGLSAAIGTALIALVVLARSRMGIDHPDPRRIA